jgi:hypothetical protein
MTTPSTARGLTESPRLVAGWALVGYAGTHLAFAFFDWLLPGDGTIAERSAGANFTNLVVLAMPIVAVLLATQVQPTLPQAKTIVTVALVEYAAILLFGLIALLIGVGAVADGPYGNANRAFDVLGYFVLGTGRLVLAAVAGLATYQAFTRLGGALPVGIKWQTAGRTPPPPPPA